MYKKIVMHVQSCCFEVPAVVAVVASEGPERPNRTICERL